MQLRQLEALPHPLDTTATQDGRTMLVFAVPFFPAVHESIVRFSDKTVRSDAYPAIGWDSAADIKTDAHPHDLTRDDERSLSALMPADTVGERAMFQLTASLLIVLDEPAVG